MYSLDNTQIKLFNFFFLSKNITFFIIDHNNNYKFIKMNHY